MPALSSDFMFGFIILPFLIIARLLVAGYAMMIGIYRPVRMSSRSQYPVARIIRRQQQAQYLKASDQRCAA